ncbi:MAG: xanthine dehydrogenase family protein molybdopterin-binding subunit [Thiotrichales bacterium]|nr:xanthine dehydrogenase family protein molybdopterin-binding subunit [Thiotrichales bacterium]
MITSIGARVPRREDAALLTGCGRFIDDIDRARQAQAWIVRSPFAHARITSIDTADAATMPGVVAVLTHRELAADGVAPLGEPNGVTGRNGAKTIHVDHPLLAGERVMHVGDPVAMVVARTRREAQEAAERVIVDYEELEIAVDGCAALEPDAPQLWPSAPGNLALDWEGGDTNATDAAFTRAAHVTRLVIVNNRVVIAPMETRGAIAEYEPRDGRYTIRTPSQGVGSLIAPLARALGVAESRVRVITDDVGGAFGIKIPPYPEQVLVAWAARRIGSPVKWIAERSESFLSDGQGRDHVTEAALALDAQGRFLAVRTATVSNMGAYSTAAAPTIPTLGGTRCITGVYRIPAWHARTRVAFTNTVPVHAYRGAGKPEYNHIIERLADTAARETGRDPAELRRLNVVPPETMPYSTGTGIEFDSGEFAANMDDALARADRSGFGARRAEAQARGMLRGFGFALFQEPDGYLDNRVTLVFRPSGELTVTLTGQTGGHGHETTFAQVASDRLGVPFESVQVRQGDSDLVGPGSGSGGSRTATVASMGVTLAAEAIVERGKRVAAELLEASAEDLAFSTDTPAGGTLTGGVYTIAGTDRSVALRDVVAASFRPESFPDSNEIGLQATSHYRARQYNYPCGCHVCEVEIDPQTGALTLVSYTAVNDHGVVINPLLLEGQVHGGVAQGLGQALLEHTVYDPDTGQLLSGSFTDYAIPRAGDLPPIDFRDRCVPARTNPLGVKGVGESGCTAACPAVMNAIADALAPLGIIHLDMPATPERIWRACERARNGNGD